MRSFDQPPLPPHLAGRGTADIDGWLKAFFRKEMPHPWPSLKPPAKAGQAAARRRPLFRSRMALAASVMVLLLGYLWVAARFPGSDALIADPTPAPAHGMIGKGMKKQRPLKPIEAEKPRLPGPFLHNPMEDDAISVPPGKR